jgi:hypothetical protein
LKCRQFLQPVSIKRIVHPEDEWKPGLPDDVCVQQLDPRGVRDNGVESVFAQQRPQRLPGLIDRRWMPEARLRKKVNGGVGTETLCEILIKT